LQLIRAQAANSWRTNFLMTNGLILDKIRLKIKQIIRHTSSLNALLLVTLAFFTYLMASITMNYIPYNTDVGFLRIKQQYISIDHWRIAFFIHVYASIWVLLAGFTQFSKNIQRTNPRLHRSMGYIYVVDVICITGPAGLIMGFYANGGITSRIAFVTLACLWIFFTSMALIKARQKNFKAHRNFMIRSYALTLSALALRAWKYGITNIAGMNHFELRPMEVYRAVAWLGWVPNLLIAEWLIRRTKINRMKTIKTKLVSDSTAKQVIK
jgi:hypothetical protein